MIAVAIDASVVLKWYLDDEEQGGAALLLLNRFASEEIDLVAPTLLEYEVINGLSIARKRGRLAEAALVEAIEAFHGLGIRLRSISSLTSRVLFYVKKYDRSVYDASYLAVAEDEKADLVTADRALCNAVSGQLPWVKGL
jgi:predicted nucleic acid-binding protein